MMTVFKDKLIKYIKKKYAVEPETPWRRFPDYTVFRHVDNQKWFGLIMDVPKDRLGMNGNEIVDILNVKMEDTFLADILIRQEGFFRGYHISRGNWISILLDGTVEFAEVCKWLDESFLATASKETKHRLRPPKEWVIPSNPKHYDIQAAFEAADEIDWKQGRGIKAGDIVFMYVGAPFSAILYKCRVTQTDIPYQYSGKINIKSLMRIKLLKRYSPDRFTLAVLARDYGIVTVRGPRGIPDTLSKDLRESSRSTRE